LSFTDGFTHLHVASSYSLRYGTATPADMVARAAELGMQSLALTDRDGLHGAFKHVSACADAGIKPLLGADLALSGVRETPPVLHTSRTPPVSGSASFKDGAGLKDTAGLRDTAGLKNTAGLRDGAGLKDTAGARVTLLACGRVGWASLCRLVSAAHAASPGSPSVTRDLIARHAEGIVVLLGPASDVGRAVAARLAGTATEALRRWHRYCEVAVEIVDHFEPGSVFRAARMASLACEEHVPAVLTNAVRYLDPADSMAASVLDAARNLVPLGSPRLVPHNGRAFLADAGTMTAIAERVAAAAAGMGASAPGASGTGAGGVRADRLLLATSELARRCVLDPVADLGLGRHHLPETSGDPGREQTVLRTRCETALANTVLARGRYRTAAAGGRRPGAREAWDRLYHELDIIAATGMASYFLTVADIADRIKAGGIRCSIRGSGAGSFVNHLLGISVIDPLEHGLLMERFLSPVRSTLPDIDLDVESARRLDAYRIIVDAYGTERTATVAMMETYRARSAIRDVAAAMSLPPDETGALAKAFPHIRARHITSALSELPELRHSRVEAPQLALLFRIAEQLDGLPRHVAMHPCGVLLSDRTLLDRTAVQRSNEGFPLSHLDKDDAEIAGVIKLDVLGVRMQSAMAHSLAEIRRVTGENIDLDAVPRDDGPTYDLIKRAKTLGCFQIESPGQRELVKKLAPADIADLIVDISLFRPGPVNSDMITPFLRIRHGQEEPRYPHQGLEQALEETGGVVIFHEQVLRMIDAMTGCGLPEADLVRRALSVPGGPERTGVWFRAQAAARGFDPAVTERVWEVVAAFGGFGFCKAHAAAFAIPVYQSAWLKRHHPAAFYAGVLTHDPGMYPKRVIIGDARLAGIEVLPLDINSSGPDWTVERPGQSPSPDSRTPHPSPPAIRTCFREVKGISDAEVTAIAAGQPYQSLRGFWERARVSRPVTENLVLAGAFDSLYPPLRFAISAAITTEKANTNGGGRRRGGGRSMTRRDLLALVGVLDRSGTRSDAPPLPLDGDGGADGLGDDLVPAGQLRELDPAERVSAELEILGFEVSGHVLDFYTRLLSGLGVVRSADLDGCRAGEEILVAGVKVATQTPAVRSGQRIIFATLDDATGLVDLTFFESVQEQCAARVFGSWLLVARGRVRRAGAGAAAPVAVTLNATGCWDIPALEEIRQHEGIAAVREILARTPASQSAPRRPGGERESTARRRGGGQSSFPTGFRLSPYAEAGGPGDPVTTALRQAVLPGRAGARALWHASPGSSSPAAG
jgi:error-prone DNA polymerase